jgi:HNH endonuclease
MKRGRILVCPIGSHGYRSLHASKNGVRKTFLVHRVVAELFLSNPSQLPCVNHKNGVKVFNAASNLEWCTHSHNIQHAFTSLARLNRKRPLIANGSVKTLRFSSVNDALDRGVDPRRIYAVLNDPSKTYSGFSWRDAGPVVRSQRNRYYAAAA